jgi:uncharacterized protein (DUF952 family)
MTAAEQFVYRILTTQQWQRLQKWGLFSGSPHDIRDGFVHLSTGPQVAGTLEKHYHHQTDLVILEMSPADFGELLKWESSRGGQLFPHLYGSLPSKSVRRVIPLADWDGR